MSLSLAKLFGYNLRKLRNEKGISQQALSNELQISKAALSYYENGQRVPDIDTLKKVAVYFNVSADFMLGLSEVSSSDKDIKDVCAYTGLKEEVIKKIINSPDEKSSIKIPLPLSYCKEVILPQTLNLQSIINLFFADGSDSSNIEERNDWIDLFRLIECYCFIEDRETALLLKNIISDFFNNIFPGYRFIEDTISLDIKPTNMDLTENKSGYPF